MARKNVLIVEIVRDVQVEGIVGDITTLDDMTVVAHHRNVEPAAVRTLVAALPAAEPGVLFVFGTYDAVRGHLNEWLAACKGLIVVIVDRRRHAVQIIFLEPSFNALLRELRLGPVSQIEIIDELVRIETPDPGLLALLNDVRSLADRTRGSISEHVGPALVHQFPGASPAAPPSALAPRPPSGPLSAGPLLPVAMEWVAKLVAGAVADVALDTDARNPYVFSSDGVAKSLYPILRPPEGADDTDRRALEDQRKAHQEQIGTTDEALQTALGESRASEEPLALAAHRLALSRFEFRVLALALAPELDPRIQRELGLLQDEVFKRLGTLGLYCALLGKSAQVRECLAEEGHLARWRVFEGQRGTLPPPDETAKLDVALACWLLGGHDALEQDPRVRRMIRRQPWPGAALIVESNDLERVRKLLASQADEDASAEARYRRAKWIVFADQEPAAWRALIERAATKTPLRVESSRLANLDVVEIEESGLRLGRMALLTGRPCIVDITASASTPEEEDGLRVLLGALGRTGCGTGILDVDAAHAGRLLGARPFTLVEAPALREQTRIAAVDAAAASCGAVLSDEARDVLAHNHPLGVDGLDLAAHLALGRVQAEDNREERCERLLAAVKDVAAEGLSIYAQRIEPAFRLDQVVLPPETKQQLYDIVDNIRLAPKVLDEWRFGELLPYGRGVGALFHGPSGTGKTMAAFAIAHALGVQVLRFNLSKILSRWLGESEKAIDLIFRDAERSGCAILVDEADAMMHKRSDAQRGSSSHERYSDIEIAFLLSRLEAYTGLVILTTNLRQNIDPAFVRRLRFMVEFPRPDVDAREKIWRGCLPEGTHTLDAADFRLLGRSIDLTGGNIRQISLRAAFIAAAANELIGLDHIARATRSEYAKVGMPPVDLHPRGRKAA